MPASCGPLLAPCGIVPSSRPPPLPASPRQGSPRRNVAWTRVRFWGRGGLWATAPRRTVMRCAQSPPPHPFALVSPTSSPWRCGGASHSNRQKRARLQGQAPNIPAGSTPPPTQSHPRSRLLELPFPSGLERAMEPIYSAKFTPLQTPTGH